MTIEEVDFNLPEVEPSKEKEKDKKDKKDKKIKIEYNPEESKEKKFRLKDMNYIIKNDLPILKDVNRKEMK